MPIKFNCNNCKNPILIKYLKPGEFAKCRNCGAENIVPSDTATVTEEAWQAEKVALESKFQKATAQLIECVAYDKSDYGGFWQRSLGSLLDGLILTVIFFLTDVFAKELNEVSLIPILLVSLILLSYEILFEFFYDGSPGYKLLGLEIISLKGTKPSLKQIIIRTFAKFFSLLPLGLGHLWVIVDKNKQTWHDKIAGTYVIKSDVKPIRTFKIDSKKLIKTRVFVGITLPFIIIFLPILAILGWMEINEIKHKEVYQVSKLYIMNNPKITQAVGEIEQLYLMIAKVSDNQANLIIGVHGTKNLVRVTTVSVKRGDNWIIIKAGYIYLTDIDEKYIELLDHSKSSSIPYIKVKDL